MPWWSWVLIWGGLALLLIVVLAAAVVWLWRKAEALFPEIERLDLIQQELEDIVADATQPYEPQRVAILRGHRAVQQERHEFTEARDERRELRRERRLARAHALTHADPMQFSHLVENPRKG